MNKFGGFFARKAGLYDKPAEPTPSNTTPRDNPLELDEELFSALGAQLGGENESLRNLLLDANAKIGELDTIKNAVGKLVDPVSKALRAFEAEKSEKISHSIGVSMMCSFTSVELTSPLRPRSGIHEIVRMTFEVQNGTVQTRNSAIRHVVERTWKARK